MGSHTDGENAILAAIEAMNEYRPKPQKHKGVPSGMIAYMTRRANACDGDEYGWVNKGEVLAAVREAMKPFRHRQPPSSIQHNNTDPVPARRADEHGDAHG